MHKNQQQREFDNLKNEIARLKKIIEWYQSTYEHRSIFGVIKSKLLEKKNEQLFFTKLKLGFDKLFKLKIKNLVIKHRAQLTTTEAISKLKKQVFCAIVNHNNNANAKLLLDTFSNYLTTQVIDSGSKIKEKEFINLPNVYYSGLYNYAFEYAKSNDYQYLLFICSDVIIDKTEAEKMLQNLTLIELNDIGVYSPASTGKSHNQCKKKNEHGFRIVDFVDRMIFLANMKVLEKFSKINTQLNLHGWGIDVAMGFYSKKIKLLNIIDDGISVHHPDETGFPLSSTEKQMANWFDTLEFGNEIIAFNENRIQLRSRAENDMKISVIVPCYNQAVYLKECIYSIFSQTYSNYEIIIINDGSTDQTDELATSLKNVFNQIRYIKQNNIGLGATRNKGLDIAQGNYIQFLDADDYFSENKFNTAIESFLNDSQLDITYSQYSCFEDGNPDKKWTYSRVELMNPPLADLINQWEKDLSIPVHCFLFKKEIIDNSRFDINLPNHEDWEFHLTIASKKPNYFFIPTATAHYRMKKIAMSQNKKLMKDGKNRCIANVISSQKIQEEYLSAMYERFDYKIVVGVVSCSKNEENINAIRNTWAFYMKKYKMPYYIIIGDPSISTCTLKDDILYVPCSDNCESLSQKVLEFYQFIYEKTEYDFVYKMDDGCFLNIENLFSTYFWNYNYFGKLIALKEDDWHRSWHKGKCNGSLLNDVQYAGKYMGPWCAGVYGYFMNREALKGVCSMADYIKTDLYEDKAVGDALRKKKIWPQENVRYRILDITQFNINHDDEAEFKNLVDQIGFSILEYEVIIKLKREFQFRIIQNKKTELIKMKTNKNANL